MSKNISSTFIERLTSLFSIDEIRLQKIFHMAQITFLGLFISLFIAPYFDKYSFEFNKNENFISLFLKASIELIILVIILYYVRKITKILPFLFNFSKKYDEFHQSSDGEALVGNTVAMAIVFMNFVGKLKKKIVYLAELTTNIKIQ
tara:strand:- start:807 stop:1247 length:441 start_codon:yes stop_codon:yes gene_type:complete